ncbi:DUF1838 domain-containing protein [Hyphomonas sp. WL0036]|uniref:DUF1838 family protein n=1 Tax=Hyphomonas sediminis TaxID=2866160 RepID=UPI001C7F164C|nr:DUF1838 family protein [Hyphomonas sediminis]MBY9066952.1 DUF1838 domain-containing protein [Hyphomonas sediminis]
MLRFALTGVTVLLAACASTAGGAAPVAETAVAETAAQLTDADVFRTWIEARAGNGQPVHWVSEGAVYAYPSGEKIMGMVGFDSSRVIWPEGEDGEVIHLTRKTFTYTDPVTGEILTELNGQPVVPIAYPYQVIRYRMKDGLIYADVEQGVEPRVQKIESKDGIIARKVGDSWAFTAPLFLNFPLPNGGQYEAWENYDFFVHPEGSVNQPYQMTWQRLGDLPAWAGGGTGIYHLLSHRVDTVDAFPPALLAWAEAEKAMWLAPPASLEEVRTLQQGEGSAGFSQ